MTSVVETLTVGSKYNAEKTAARISPGTKGLVSRLLWDELFDGVDWEGCLMGYRQALLRRWSRRDRLAVLVIAVTVAFLTGATVLLFAVGAQTASVAAEFDSLGSVKYVVGVPADIVQFPTRRGPDEGVNLRIIFHKRIDQV